MKFIKNRKLFPALFVRNRGETVFSLRETTGGFFTIGLILLILFHYDEKIYRATQTLPPFIYKIAAYVTTMGKTDILLIPLFLYYVGARPVAGAFVSFRYRHKILRARLAVTKVFLTVAITGIIVNLLKYTIGRARPKLYESAGSEAFQPLNIIFEHYSVAAYDYASLPSGHTATAFAFALSIGAIFPRCRTPLLIVAFAVALSRILLGSHYFSDTIAGAAVAFIVQIFIARKFSRFKVTNIDRTSAPILPPAFAVKRMK